MASKTGTRLKKLEQAKKPGEDVWLCRIIWTDEEPKPPEEEIVHPVINGKRVEMTYADFLKLYPDYIDETEHIIVTYEDGEE